MSAEEKNAGNGTFAALYRDIFREQSFRKSLKLFGTSIASLDPETVQLPACSMLWEPHAPVSTAEPEAKPHFSAVLKRSVYQ